MLVLLVYLVTRCCDRKPRPRRSITLLKCSLAILALLCSGAVAVGLYGNDDVHNGLVQLVAAAKNVDGILMGVRNQVRFEFIPTNSCALVFKPPFSPFVLI